MKQKSAIIIGAGISGLSTGSYLQMNGYSTRIFEKHAISGGLCTGWARRGYTLDGCIHWLLGSAQGSAFHKLWTELIDFNDIEFVNHSIRVYIETLETADKYGNHIFKLYSNIDKLEEYLLDLSPEDCKPITELIDSIRFLQKYELPPLIEKAPQLRTLADQMNMLKLLPLIGFIKRWSKITNKDFADRLKNPFLKEAFMLLYEGKIFSMLIMTMQLAYFSIGCAGFPKGGSLSLAKRLEEKYLKLGGSIIFNTGVSQVITKNGIATGILTEDGRIEFADIVVSAADWKFTVFDALGGKYSNKTIESLKNQQILQVFDSAILVSLGISRTFEDYPHLLRFPVRTLTLPDGSEFDRMEAHIYNYDDTMAPAGKTVVSVTLPVKNADYWIELRKTDYAKYKAIKDQIAKDVIDILESKFADIKAKIEIIDVATPATFSRYTGNWKGSIQGWMPSEKLFSPSPVKPTLPGLKNFYMTGHWLEPGGGLPIALLTGRNISQVICKNDGKQFRVI